MRLIGAVLLEANDEWQIQNRYMQTEQIAELMSSAAVQPALISSLMPPDRVSVHVRGGNLDPVRV